MDGAEFLTAKRHGVSSFSVVGQRRSSSVTARRAEMRKGRGTNWAGARAKKLTRTDLVRSGACNIGRADLNMTTHRLRTIGLGKDRRRWLRWEELAPGQLRIGELARRCSVGSACKSERDLRRSRRAPICPDQ